MTDFPLANEWRTATIEKIAEKVAVGPFGSSIKVETFVPEGVPFISDYSLGGSDLDLVLRVLDLGAIPVRQLIDLEEALQFSTIPFQVEMREWAPAGEFSP